MTTTLDKLAVPRPKNRAEAVGQMRQRRHIAHVIFRLDYGGMENGLVNLINLMHPEAYRHSIVCLTEYTEFSERIEKKDVSVYALNKKPGKDFSMYIRLWKLLREIKPDILHTRNVGTIDTIIPAFFAGVRGFVHGEHGIDILNVDGEKARFSRYRRFHAPFVQKFIAVAPSLEEMLRRQLGRHQRKIVLIKNGVDTKKFYPNEGLREELPMTGFALTDDFVIGSVGRLDSVKDPATLVMAFLQLHKQFPLKKLKLVLVGDGPLRAVIEALLRDHNAEMLAWCPGSRSDIPKLLRSIDLFVLSSRAEGMSNAILEAMASGVPVVATDVGANSELVEHRVTGALVAPEDSLTLAEEIQRYITDSELRKIHGRKGRLKIVRHFSIESTVGRYQELYDEVLSVR